jgi:murein DD-endopeptidase MepM/ murein hydrolase activator NlpD
MRRTILTLAALLFSLGSTASADIYRYVDDEGTVCFTDAPQNREARLFLRDPHKPARYARGSTVPRHLAATGIEEKVSPKPIATSAPLSSQGSLPVPGRITSLTGLRIDPIDGVIRQHNGVDIAIPKGTPVKPVAPGTVVFSGRRPGYGNMVVVDHGGVFTVYAHHDHNTVTEGEPVTEGTVIASSGSTGRSTGPHLHFEAWDGGINITERFTGTTGASMAIARASLSQPTPIRRGVQPDGSLLFTNLPLQHP